MPVAATLVSVAPWHEVAASAASVGSKNKRTIRLQVASVVMGLASQASKSVNHLSRFEGYNPCTRTKTVFNRLGMTTHATPSQSAEDYLERIHELIEEKGYARVVDIASSLKVKQASVTSMVQKLGEAGYLTPAVSGLAAQAGRP